MKRNWLIILTLVIGLMFLSCGIGGTSKEQEVSEKEECTEEPGRVKGIIGYIDLRGAMYFEWYVTPGIVEGYWLCKIAYDDHYYYNLDEEDNPDNPEEEDHYTYSFHTSNNALVYGFKRDVTYLIWILAANRCGNGEWSEPYFVTY